MITKLLWPFYGLILFQTLSIQTLFQNIIAVYMYVMYSICIALHQLNAIKHNLEKSRTIKKMACHAGCWMWNVKLKGHFCSQIDFFFILDPISRHNSKTPHVFRIPDFDLKPAQILENVPLLVLANLANTGWGFGKYRLVIWPIPVGYLANTGWRFRIYRLAISPIPVMVHFQRFWQVWGRNREF